MGLGPHSSCRCVSYIPPRRCCDCCEFGADYIDNVPTQLNSTEDSVQQPSQRQNAMNAVAIHSLGLAAASRDQVTTQPSNFREAVATRTLHRVNGRDLSATRMWANAQRDGRPTEYRWRPLFNAAKFGWRPLLDCRAVTKPRRETR